MRKFLTQPQTEALVWLWRNGSTGVFCKPPQHHVFVAQGGKSPFMRSTWLKLVERNLATKDDKRITLTDEGKKLAERSKGIGITGSERPQSEDADDDGTPYWAR